MHNGVEAKIQHIPASLPKPGTMSTTIKELDLSLRVLQIPASLRKPDELPIPDSARPPRNEEWSNLPRPTPDALPVGPSTHDKGEDSAMLDRAKVMGKQEMGMKEVVPLKTARSPLPGFVSESPAC
ncbi:hypothetical protein AMTR_s00112p00055490 [Amborella trichopoda]|uniref:Uncharacterized protein n=1 Tax=Amborella trichopoda TaxID=13333 RepID=W1NXV3_AMBTC|nr:hypothetical protein AMTR_s00112p00055490 [Amborella trichopoda]